ncbi:hypothetical protein KB553_20445 [Chryseobacterium rhizoplanae]|uniref:hypothetical protein n=1 Tax=Chryseobacterium rhizoplanae TaxID=1609531 RepID=UPI001CE24CD6|nr:hypothetical protein [Chryseobacterium rhizoplanae]UCA59362.1 hypothetical protein KB553_20445 [Chryseobacterium rhizoplanae]
MIERLKNAIFNISDFEYINFYQNSESIKFIYYDVIVHGNKDSILVFYDAEEMGVFNKLRFINKKNSLEKFNTISDALNYMKYLSKVASDIRYETYHYFIYKLKETKIDTRNISFGFGGNYANYSKENLSIRCDISDISIKENKIKFNFVVTFDKDYKCKLWFYPENPVWNEGKECPETDVDKIIEYILNLKVYSYDDIPLKES